jgi:hypothetical protein
MRVLVACEYSGRVRDAFLANGHDAMSCDLLPTDTPGPHYQGDVRDILGDGWDMMIAFPPCNHLAAIGARFWREKQADGRQGVALDFVRELMNAPIDRIAIENPVGRISTAIRKPDQIIEPLLLWRSLEKIHMPMAKESPAASTFRAGRAHGLLGGRGHGMVSG